MPAMEFRVTDEEGAYLCMVQALIFEGSILAYNPTRDEGEWVPTRGVANDLSWVEERTAVTLANFVPHAPQEMDHIMELETNHLLGWTDDSSSEEEDKQTQEEDVKPEGDKPEGDEHKEIEGWGETYAKLPSSDVTCGQGKTKLQIKPPRWSWECVAIMDDEQPLAFNDPWSDSDHSPVHLTPLELGPPEDAMEVHVWDPEVEAFWASGVGGPPHPPLCKFVK